VVSRANLAADLNRAQAFGIAAGLEADDSLDPRDLTREQERRQNVGQSAPQRLGRGFAPLTLANTECRAAPFAVYADSAYGTGAFLTRLEAAAILPVIKVQPPQAPHGHFAKDRFTIDLDAGTVTCPADFTAPIRRHRGGGGVANFGPACATCPLVSRCTSSPKGRVIIVGPHESELTRARNRQRDPQGKDDYRATRPKAERKIAHLMRRLHGGRRARVRGQPRVAWDFSLLGAAVNLARLAALGACSAKGRWAVATA
jgi:hypothetical protein